MVTIQIKCSVCGESKWVDIGHLSVEEEAKKYFDEILKTMVDHTPTKIDTDDPTIWGNKRGKCQGEWRIQSRR